MWSICCNATAANNELVYTFVSDFVTSFNLLLRLNRMTLNTKMISSVPNLY